jgi:hypothetical protein
MGFRWISPCEGSGRICQYRILAQGEIEWESADQFKAFLREQQTITDASQWREVELCFDSPGGDLEGALRLGEVIQAMRLDTCVEPIYSELHGTQAAKATPASGPSRPTVCASACVFAFAAGAHRTISAGARIGMHQFAGADRELGQRRTQLAMTTLAQFLERNGVGRQLLDIAAYAPNWMMRYLTAQEISGTRLDNTAQVYENWKLAAWSDGSVYAHIEQRNPLTDNWTGLMLYKRADRVWLDIVSYPARREQNSPPALLNADLKTDGGALNTLLAGADIWLRADEEDFADFGKAPWMCDHGGSCVRRLAIPATKLASLRTAQLLEVWVTGPQLAPRVNPSMAFQLDSLKPFLAAVLK